MSNMQTKTFLMVEKFRTIFNEGASEGRSIANELRRSRVTKLGTSALLNLQKVGTKRCAFDELHIVNSQIAGDPKDT
jgi:hypothetical protein